MKFIKEFVLNKTNETEYYGVDLRNSDSVVIQFKGPSALFALSLSEGEEKDQIIQKVLNQFSDVTKDQIEDDFNRFVKHLENLNILTS